MCIFPFNLVLCLSLQGLVFLLQSSYPHSWPDFFIGHNPFLCLCPHMPFSVCWLLPIFSILLRLSKSPPFCKYTVGPYCRLGAGFTSVLQMLGAGEEGKGSGVVFSMMNLNGERASDIGLQIQQSATKLIKKLYWLSHSILFSNCHWVHSAVTDHRLSPDGPRTTILHMGYGQNHSVAFQGSQSQSNLTDSSGVYCFIWCGDSAQQIRAVGQSESTLAT